MFAVVAATLAQADELPLRKPGLWELKPPWEPNTTVQHCTDAAVDKKMMQAILQADDFLNCPKREVRKTATGYIFEFQCKMPVELLSREVEFIGDFDTGFTMKETHKDITKTVEVKWLGACKPDQKPGDMDTFTRVNIKEYAP